VSVWLLLLLPERSFLRRDLRAPSYPTSALRQGSNQASTASIHCTLYTTLLLVVASSAAIDTLRKTRAVSLHGYSKATKVNAKQMISICREKGTKRPLQRGARRRWPSKLVLVMTVWTLSCRRHFLSDAFSTRTQVSVSAKPSLTRDFQHKQRKKKNSILKLPTKE
jgi:hypothetical protein